MKAYIFRKLETTEEVSSHGDHHSVTNWERITVTRTGAVSVKVLPPEQTWTRKRTVFKRPIWRSESGELFIQDQAELGTDAFLGATNEVYRSKPWRFPCRINGELVPHYEYSQIYYTE